MTTNNKFSGLLLVAAASLLTLNGCGAPEPEEPAAAREQTREEPIEQPVQAPVAEPPAQAAEDPPPLSGTGEDSVDLAAGQRAYQTHCQACHQADGSGLRGAFPPLRDNPNIAGRPAYVAEIILMGQSGPIEVQGVSYNGVMPPMSHLTDQQVADISSFVMNSFDNDGGEIKPSEVREQRAELGLAGSRR